MRNFNEVRQGIWDLADNTRQGSRPVYVNNRVHFQSPWTDAALLIINVLIIKLVQRVLAYTV